MSKPDKTLDPKILDAAKKEFLEKGYEKASTNAICKSAGVTWGALQKRYSGKDALFCALVAPVAEEFKATLIGATRIFTPRRRNSRKPRPCTQIGTEILLWTISTGISMYSGFFCAVRAARPMNTIWMIWWTSWSAPPAASWKPQAMRLLSTEKSRRKNRAYPHQFLSLWAV